MRFTFITQKVDFCFILREQFFPSCFSDTQEVTFAIGSVASRHTPGNTCIVLRNTTRNFVPVGIGAIEGEIWTSQHLVLSSRGLQGTGQSVSR